MKTAKHAVTPGASHTQTILATVVDFRFSPRSLPIPAQALKKYIKISIGALAGFGYWGETDEYNIRHGLSPVRSVINIAGVTCSSGFFLLQAVDLANSLLDELAGTVPDELKDIIVLPPEEQRKSTRRRTFAASIVSGFPFLIIALVSTLPPFKYIQSEVGYKFAVWTWALFFCGLNVELHLLPFVILQLPNFWYYRLPLIGAQKVGSAVQCRSRQKKQGLDFEIKNLQAEINKIIDPINAALSARVASSLKLLAKEAADQVRFICDYKCTTLDQIFKEKNGIDRILHLLEKCPPRDDDSIKIPGKLASTIPFLGAVLQLGAGYAWWTNVYPTLFKIFTKFGTEAILAYFLTGLLGSLPSYAIIVILCFVGQIQVPQLVNNLINLPRRLLGRDKTESAIPPAAKVNPPIFALITLLILGISYISPINSISVNEQEAQEQESPKWFMIILQACAITGVPIMTFMSLMDLCLRYLKEMAAIFSQFGSKAQRLAHLLIISETLPKDLMRLPPQILDELCQLDDGKIQLLLGSDKTQESIKEQKKEVDKLFSELATKKVQQEMMTTPLTILPIPAGYQTQQPPSTTSWLTSAYNLVSSVFCCCRKRSKVITTELRQPFLASPSVN